MAMPVKKQTNKDEVLAFECFRRWQSIASNELNESFSGRQREFFNYFKVKVFPNLSRTNINSLIG